jgi:DNA-binding CsgD family transcriptional regulator/tetratricopeptide (TPR) repeat protein
MVNYHGQIFVGREREMAGLRAAMDAAMDGHGQVVMLAGEPGIGKTRTAQELASYAESSGAQVWWGSCHEQQGAPPYWLWVQPIRSYIQRTDADSLVSQMGQGAADLSEIIPEVRDKLPGFEPTSPLEPVQARFRLFDSITQFLRNLAQSQLLMLVLDDLHWADQPSLLLLEFLAGQLSDSKIMLVGTYRDTEVSREHPLSKTLAQFARSGSYQREELKGLETEHIGQLIKDISGAEPSPEMVQAIYGHTEGNPFFMTEIIRLLGEKHQATGGLEEDDFGGLGVPQSVLEVVGQRLNRLSTECEAILTTAAVIGRQFDFKVLGSLSEDTSESQLLKLIDEGLDAHLIQEVPGQGDAYQFSHALVQQTLRERLSTSRRVRLHARIGETWETLYGDQPGDHTSELAYHFAQAEPVAGIANLVKYASLAGERALESYAPEEALEHFQRGLIAKGLDVDGRTPLPDAEAAALRFGLGRAQAATLGRQQLDVASASLGRAFDFYAETNDVARAGSVAGYLVPPRVGNRVSEGLVARALQLIPPDSVEAGRLLSMNVLVMGLEEADYSGAMEAFQSAIAIAQRTGDTALERRTLANSAIVDFWHLQWQETITKGLRAIDLARLAADQSLELSTRFWVGVALLSEGKSKEAQPHASTVLSMAENVRDRYQLATALWLNERSSMYEGNWQDAKDFNDRGLLVSPSDTRLLATRMVLEHELGNEIEGNGYLERLVEALRLVTPGATYDSASVAAYLPVVARITGEVDQLHIAESAAATVLSAETATPFTSRYARLGLGVIAALRGDVEAAKEHYASLVSATGTYSLISGDRVLGLLAQTIGDLDQAVTHFEDALVFSRKAGYRPELAWSCHDYADLLLERNAGGDRARAINLLDESISASGELGMRPLSARSAALREKAESVPVRAPTFPDGLTQREVGVIRLVAAGRTDREIADELVIAVRTVTTHVGNILNKTGAANRAEAASFANRHGLVTPDSDCEG